MQQIRLSRWVRGIFLLGFILWTPPTEAGEAASGSAQAGLSRRIPRPLAHHPGNIFLEGEVVRVSMPTPGKWTLLDAEDQVVRQLDLKEPAADLGKLPVGFYRLRTEGQPDWISLGVIAPLQAPTPESSPIALDVAMSWFYPPEKMPEVASLCALAGVNWVRDRLSWPGVEPQPGKFAEHSRYDAAAEAQAAAGLKVLQVFHATPQWASQATKRFPPDLRDAYRFLRHAASRWKGKVLAFEPWNEADITVFGGHTGAEMASYQKAAYWGVKAGNPEAIVCWNVFASDNPAHQADVAANEVWPYFETFNFHHYRPFDQYPRLYGDFRAVAAGRPLWVTECAMPLPWTGDPARKELSDRDLLEQARRLIKVYAGSLHEGTVATFYFLLPHYVERKTQFGIIRPDLTPRPAYVALAAVGRWLADARPLGRLKNDNLQAYLFRALPDGQPKTVLVAWANGPETLKLPQKPLAGYDYLGRPKEVASEIVLSPSPVFVLLPVEEADKLERIAPPKPLPLRPGQPCPIVLQATWPANQLDLKQSAYRLAADAAEVTVPIYLYHFGREEAKGRFTVKVPEGWTAKFSAEELLRPGDRLDRQLQVTVPAAGFDGPATIRIEGDFGPLGRPVLSFRLVRR
ncbi:MAG TPA: hypothetical protein PLQ00_10510 [Thermoguttaceae bacterium]|mgnify:CR=1 FL=1|nr:hypothetical protein [Thermoguttaceae bacterium]